MASEFSAEIIGNYGNVVVMEVAGNYDAHTSGGVVNAEPRQVIAKEFYKNYKDNYDFLVIFSNFDFKMPEAEADAFYMGVRNDTSGIGRPIVDNSGIFGSNGKLQGVVDMGNITSNPSDPLEKWCEKTLNVLSHEILHRWAAYVRFRNADGTLSTALLAKDQSHWSYLLDSYGSVQYGNQWRDNGNGTFTSIAAKRYYSPLDLYLMGLVDRAEVPPMLLIDNSGIDPGRKPEKGVTIDGTPRYVTIHDIIAAEGERNPGPADSQKSFKTAFIFITTPGTFTGDELVAIETIRNEWVKRFSILTDGRAIVQVALFPKEDIPANPGPGSPESTPRTLPPNMREGVKWLIDRQNPDGSWFDLDRTAARDTAEALNALRYFAEAQQSCASGIRWLSGEPLSNIDYLSRRIEMLESSGENTRSLVEELLSKRNPDGGWGTDGAYASNPVDTSFALKALSAVGFSDHDTLAGAIDYLKGAQNGDGGWGQDEGSKIEVTANVLRAFNRYREEYRLESMIALGLAWLSGKQGPDGGFGSNTGTVYDTAMAVVALHENGGPREIINKGLTFLLNLQSQDGSWHGSVHQTALAVSALWMTTLEPDLEIKSERITFTPPKVTKLPVNIVVNANVRNLGRTGIAEAKIVLYEDAVSEASRIGEQVVAISGESSVDVAFSATVRDGEDHRFYVQLDPDSLVNESNETNNQAFGTIGTLPTYDFEVLPSDVGISPNPVVINEEVAISSRITNHGTMNAYNVKVRYGIDDTAGPVEIASKTVNIPANTTIQDHVAWKPDQDGNSLPVTVWVDPFNSFTEISKTNNKASVPLTVWTATLEPDLAVKAQDITVVPSTIALLPVDITVRARVWNLGQTEVSRARVFLYDGSPSDGTRMGEELVTVPGQSFVEVTFPATIRDGDEHRFHVLVDPDNLVSESNENNNLALAVLKPTPTYDFEILPSSIIVEPNPVETAHDVRVSCKVSNRGTMDAYNVKIRTYVDEASGPIDISTKTVAIPANGSVSSEVVWKANRPGSDLPITIWVDPFNSHDEISEANNKASGCLTVHESTDPNLSLSHKDIVIDPAIPNEGGRAILSALVKNDGASAADNVTINLYKGVPGVDGVAIGSRVISSIEPGASEQVSFEWDDIRESGEKILYISVDPENLVKETSEEDNGAFKTVQILSLPDLAISSNSIGFSPSAPKEGDTVSINVSVKNLGEQGASNVSVKALEDGHLIGTQSIPMIAGNSQATAAFSSETAGKKGPREILVTIDSENTITERSKDNNRASRTFGVQDANLWVTERFISPNGDGVRDSTQFFFRLNEARTVRILVVHERGETVRTFEGDLLKDTKGDNVTWDGLNRFGMVVDDGPYHLQLVDEGENILGALMVVVDNNRSPLTKAIGTTHLLNSNLTCLLPDVSTWDWFPDESGILFHISNANENTPEYPPGLYTVSPDGEDIMKITPVEWVSNEDITYNIRGYKVSPDGNQIAIAISKESINHTIIYELWIIDRDGRNRHLIDTWDPSLVQWGRLELYGWYNNDHIIYGMQYYVSSKLNYETWVVSPDKTAKIQIDDEYINHHSLKRSVDGTRVVYFSFDRVILNDLAGNKQELMAGTDCSNGIVEWLNDEKLVMLSGAELWILDAGGSGHHIKLSDSLGSFSVSPEKTRVAYLELSQGAISVKMADGQGNLETLYDVERASDNDPQRVEDIRWSPDGTKIAFVDRTYERRDLCNCLFYGYIIIIDSITKIKKAYKLSTEYLYEYCESHADTRMPDSYVMYKNAYSGCQDSYTNFYGSYNPADDSDTVEQDPYALGSLIWLSDNVTLLGVKKQRNFVMSTLDGRINHLPIKAVIDRVSPLGRYFNYKQGVEEASICFERGQHDLWAMSSLLNLVADLRITKEKSAVILKGIATDLNFEGYMLEVADARDPDVWNLAKPASDVAVVNDVLTTWVPPYEGQFFVKLTVWDKAGNRKWERKRVSWGLASSITNLYKTAELISPNGDGIQDAVELHYKSLEPVHLEFNILDKNDNIVRTYFKDHVAPTEDYINWDGRDLKGQVVPDGKYRIQVYDYEFYVDVDNTPPDINIDFSDQVEKSDPWTLSGVLNGHVFDDNIKHWRLEYGEGDNPHEWYEYGEGRDLRAHSPFFTGRS